MDPEGKIKNDHRLMSRRIREVLRWAVWDGVNKLRRDGSSGVMSEERETVERRSSNTEPKA